ncbi:MAG: glutaredoxin family protein [Acidobacteriota bacterium]
MRRFGRAPAGTIGLELLTRGGCHLCEEMAAVLDATLPELGLGYRRVDVDADPDLRQRFGETIPVLLRDGLPVAKVRVSANDLRRILARRRG